MYIFFGHVGITDHFIVIKRKHSNPASMYMAGRLKKSLINLKEEMDNKISL
jgi:hypothetical protein